MSWFNSEILPFLAANEPAEVVVPTGGFGNENPIFDWSVFDYDYMPYEAAKDWAEARKAAQGI